MGSEGDGEGTPLLEASLDKTLYSELLQQFSELWAPALPRC